MLPFLFDDFGNPSSSHFFGLKAKQAVEEARSSVASLVHCKPSEVRATYQKQPSNNGTRTFKILADKIVHKNQEKRLLVLTRCILRQAELNPTTGP